MQTELRAHHLVNLFFCFGQAEEREERIEQQLEAFVAWRGPEIMEPSRKLLLQIANHPNLRIKIILGGKDGFCEGCSKLEECQYGKGADWVDKETIEVLGIEEGNDYSLEEIIKKAREAIMMYNRKGGKVRPGHRAILEQIAPYLEEDTP